MQHSEWLQRGFKTIVSKINSKCISTSYNCTEKRNAAFVAPLKPSRPPLGFVIRLMLMKHILIRWHISGEGKGAHWELISNHSKIYTWQFFKTIWISDLKFHTYLFLYHINITSCGKKCNFHSLLLEAPLGHTLTHTHIKTHRLPNRYTLPRITPLSVSLASSVP